MIANKAPYTLVILCMTILAGVASAIGCGSSQSGPPRFQVSGKANFDGNPIPGGEILFVPDASEGNRGTATLLEIKDGQYTTEDGNGLIGGAYKIEISGFSQDAGTDVDGEVIVKPLFRTYSMQNLFPIEDTQFDIEVPKNRRR
ncbi:hypothetical protein [Bremerella alba]|uniref:Carboxypeptidase regulatory-like domain-containing protein n=1 Tax=Bremerella alba TaxID=980252 RepID=A0A7V8V6Z3_9BACT|nr:hypothetical protein [Bremerella alba]MBA2115871.1 hypothetical protein [Bremerella alba]